VLCNNLCMTKTPSTLIRRDTLDRLRESLRNLPAQTVETKSELTVKEVISLFRNDLIELRDKRNYTLPQLCDHLAKNGVAISPPTLRSYLVSKRRKKADAAKTEFQV
jgi:hypothetical protein